MQAKYPTSPGLFLSTGGMPAKPLSLEHLVNLPGPLREEVDRVLEENDPREVEKMITNIERTLDEMKRQALVEGKVEVAKAALRKGFSVEDVAEITGLSRETVLELKKAG